MTTFHTVLFTSLAVLTGSLAHADNLLPQSDFKSASPSMTVNITNGAETTSLPGWRIFNAGAIVRAVRFSIVDDPTDDTRGVSMELTSNPQGETGGRIGFDIDQAPLPIREGQRLLLKFKAKRTSSAPCAVMATLSGRNAAGAVVAQTEQVFMVGEDFRDFTHSEWTMPDGATHLNVIFNLVSGTEEHQPTDPCGVIIEAIDLEKR
jgi:hypothetical protein